MKRKLLYIIFFLITFFSFALKTKAISNINLSSGSLNPLFNKEVYKYNIYLSENTTELNISASLEEDDDFVEGIGNTSLINGENEIELKVHKKDGSVLTYILKIFVGEIIEDESILLKSLEIKGYDINFDTNTFNYELNILDEDELDIDYEVYNSNVTVKLEGNSNFHEGNNTILITVISKETKEKNVYKIKVNKTKEVYKELTEKIVESSIFSNMVLNDSDKLLLRVTITSITFIIILFIYKLFFVKRKTKKRTKKVKK